MKKKVLVVGEHFSENLGDGVISHSVEYLIRESFPEVELIRSDLSGRKQFMNTYKRQNLFSARTGHYISKQLHRHLDKHTLPYALFVHGRFNRWVRIKNISRREYDLAVFTGGQLFMDYFSLPLHQYMKELSKRGTPTIFNSCGMGSRNSPWLQNKLIQALSYSNIHSVTVRDNIDLVNETLLSKDRPAIQSYDCALWTKEAFNTHKKHSSTVGLGVISLNHKKDQEVTYLFTDIIQQLNEKVIPWELFCNGSFTDYELALKIARKNGYDESVIGKRSLTPAELVETISTYRSIISFRLHSHVIAVSLEIPSIAIVWDNKAHFFFDNIHCSDRLFHYDSKAADVLRKLFEAESDGYNEELILCQKEKCQASLVDPVTLILEDSLSDTVKTPLNEVEV